MPEKDHPIQPPGEESPTDPPAAVQWMMQQAAAGQSAETTPVPRSSLWAEPPAGSTAVKLAAREQRASEALRGNARLTQGLPDEAADTLMTLGLDMARLVVRDTAELDDIAAEDILQPRIRAVRRLMMAVARATDPAIVEAPAEWVEQAAVALGDRFTPPDEVAAAAFGGGWRALRGRPADQIAVLRRFIEEHTGPGA
jgi:hypothetical protein